jgi:uncharacterized protein (DUF1684 family)
VDGWKSEIRNPKSEISARAGGRIEYPASSIEDRAGGVCYNTPMKMPASHTCRLSIVVTLLLSLTACAQAPPPIDPAYAAEVEEWRSARLERLTADDGWLTLTGLYWLEPGENFFGSGEDNVIVLPDESVPGVAGQVVLGTEGAVTVIAAEGAVVNVNGEPITEARLNTDAAGAPDVVMAGRIHFYIIDREGRLAARVKDPEAATLTEFAGIEHFPISESFRVEARLEAYEEPKEVAVPTVLGQDTTYVAPGVLHFAIDGDYYSLEPYLSGPEDESYFLIFRDATSAVTTYGAGRFLYASAAGDDGTTVLDFNLAYNPPCAFTPYATCPLPPPQNWLLASIEAGEKYSGEAH